MPDADRNSWTPVGTSYELLGGRVALLPGGTINVRGKQIQLEDGQEAEISAAEGTYTVRFSDGRWSFRRVEETKMLIVASTTIRIRLTKMSPIIPPYPDVRSKVDRTKAKPIMAPSPEVRTKVDPPRLDADPWPRWKRSEIVTLVALGLLVVGALFWYLVKR